MYEYKKLLYSLILKSMIDIESEYKKFMSLIKRVEYYIGEKNGYGGYFSTQFLEDLIIGHFYKFKVLDSKSRKKYDFKFYFDANDDLIFIERFFIGAVSFRAYIYNYNEKKEIFYYDSQNNLYLVAECIYDEFKRIKKYLYTDYIIFKTEIVCFVENLYDYYDDEVLVKSTLNITRSSLSQNESILTSEYRYPLSE